MMKKIIILVLIGVGLSFGIYLAIVVKEKFDFMDSNIEEAAIRNKGQHPDKGPKEATAPVKTLFLTEDIPGSTPIEFMESLTPTDKIIHRGIFSPDLAAYYYTISDKDFEHFDVYVIRKSDGEWSTPEVALFNSKYDDHGMSFSPDGNVVYFSSTRPANIEGVSKAWHIWKTEKANGTWTEPEFVDIPNLRNKLVSHPTVAKSGTLYFHASNLDYTAMDIYRSTQKDGEFQAAEKVLPTQNIGKCTPFVSPDEDFLIFATIGKQLDLHVSYNDGQGNWTKTKQLNGQINHQSQGNPYVTPGQRFLFFATGEHEEKKWKIKWVNIASELVMN